MSFTLKAGHGGDSPWIVFDGPVEGWRSDMLHVFGVTEETRVMIGGEERTIGSLSLAEVGCTLAGWLRDIHAGSGGGPARKLGTSKPAASQSASSGSGPARATAQPAKNDDADIIKGISEAIANATDLDALKRVLTEHKDRIKGTPELSAAFSARGKALK